MTKDTVEEKASLRNEVLVRRNAVPREDREKKSTLVCDRLFDHVLDALASTEAKSFEPEEAFPLKGKKIAVYSSMKSEVSLDAFIRKAYQQGAHIYFPCMTKKEYDDDRISCRDLSSSMVFREIPEDHYTRHHEGAVGTIPFMDSPMKSYFLDDPSLDIFPVLDGHDIDIVAVPLVAFDDGLNRLGYGGGNYDEFLAGIPESACVVGVAFTEQQVEKVPMEKHDRALPHVVSA